MKKTLNYPAWILITSMFVGVGAAQTEAADLESIKTALQNRSLPDFATDITANNWKPPFIPSQWYCGRVNDLEEKNRLTAARNFGRSMAIKLDQWADVMIAADGLETNRELSRTMYDLADWIGSHPGYGNVFLAARLQDIALIGVGRLVTNLNCPDTVIVELMSRGDVSWTKPPMRANIMNLEARTNLFRAEAYRADDGGTALYQDWENGQKLQIMGVSSALRSAFEGDTNNSNGLGEIFKAWKVAALETPVIAANLDFFKDDSLVGNHAPTTLATWDLKWHGRLASGFNPRNRERLEALFHFRQRVGSFPVTPTDPATSEPQKRAIEDEQQYAARNGIQIVSSAEVFGSLGKAAFAQAWEQFGSNKSPNLYATAWQVYSEISTGEFVDEDTRLNRFAAALGDAP